MSGSPEELCIPALAAVSEDFLDAGHLWLHEYPDGTPFGLRLGDDGRLQFAFTDPASETQPSPQWVHAERVPPEYGFAVRDIQQRFDRMALQNAVSDPAKVTLWCIAVHRRHRGYNWELAPSVVGIDIAYPESTFLPHELEQVFAALGLATLPTLDTEVHVREVASTGVSTPETNWGEGPAFGVLYRKKGGGLAKTRAQAYQGEPEGVEPLTCSAETYAAEVASDGRLNSLVETLADANRPPSVQSLTDLVVDRTLRDAYPRLTHSETTLDIGALQSAVARRVGEFLGEGS